VRSSGGHDLHANACDQASSSVVGAVGLNFVCAHYGLGSSSIYHWGFLPQSNEIRHTGMCGHVEVTGHLKLIFSGRGFVLFKALGPLVYI